MTRIPCFILILLLASCQAQEKLIDHPFVIDEIPIQGKADQFHSDKLDHLLGRENGVYFYPDITGTADSTFSLTAVAIDGSRSILLFYDQKNILRDTVSLFVNQTFSLNALLQNNKRGVCIGTFNEKSQLFKIAKIYELTQEVRLKKVSSATTILDCPPPPEYVTEDRLLENFKYEDPNGKTHVRAVNSTVNMAVNIVSEWRISCDNELTILDITGEEAYLSLNSNNQIFINARVKKQTDGIYAIFFEETDHQEYFYEDQPNVVDANIAKDIPIGKLTVVSNDEMRLDWLGLYDKLKQERTFVNNFIFYKVNGSMLPIMIHRCNR